MSTDRRMAVIGGRIAGGLAGTAAAAAVVGAVLWAPLPAISAAPVSTRVAPVATDAVRVCPGDVLTVGADAAAATAITAIPGADVVDASGPDDAAPRTSALSSPDVVDGDAGASAVSVAASAGGSAAPLVAAAQSQIVADETHSGLAVAACGEATPESWLVAGSTDVGRSALVVLSNPSTVQASVDLTVYGENGPVAAPAASGILVEAGSQRVVPLAGLAPDVLSPVVHVVAHGGEVAAVLQSSIVRGLEPGGVDIQAPLSAAAESLSIPGVVVAEQPRVVATDSETASGDDAPGLRLLAPGDVDTVATVSVVGEGDAPGTSFTVRLEAGVVVEAPLDLPVGVYAVRVVADHPVVAAARTATTGAAGRDVAWFAAVPALDSEPTLVQVADPTGAAAVLHAWNPGETDAAFTLTPASGDPLTVKVPAGSAVAQSLDAGASYRVDDARGLSMAVGYRGDGLIASAPVAAGSELAAPLTVYPR